MSNLYRFIMHVSGKVQGVGYREYCRRRAQYHNIRGSATNLLDGRVKVLGEGSLEDLDVFYGELFNPPKNATVRGITRKTREIEKLSRDNFVIKTQCHILEDRHH